MKVLYATDGLPPALQAGDLIARMAARGGLELTVMSVTHAGLPAPEHVPLVMDPLESRRQDTLTIVDAAAERMLAEGFKVGGHTCEGHPAEEIIKTIERDWYDLTVLGGGSGSWLGNVLLGSVSTQVLHTSPSSVLIVHSVGERDDARRILVGADGSRGADLAARMVMDFADPERCEISVVSVAREPMSVPSPDLGYMSDELDEKTKTQLLDEANRHAEHVSWMFRDRGFSAETKSLIGRPAPLLLEEADAVGADVVAVGSRGLGRVRRALVGSVSDHVARHAPAALVARRLVV